MIIKENCAYINGEDVVILEWFDDKTVWLRRGEEDIAEFNRPAFEKTFKLNEGNVCRV